VVEPTVREQDDVPEEIRPLDRADRAVELGPSLERRPGRLRLRIEAQPSSPSSQSQSSVRSGSRIARNDLTANACFRENAPYQ
jgi:hypothetical protein